MTIEAKVLAVEQLFHNLDLEIAEFQKQTSLHCMAGCGKCCTHPDIDASPLEFLPWAFHLFLNGDAEAMLDSLNADSSSSCANFRPIGLLASGSGSCSSYQYRGLICRLFGFGANTDKHGKLRIATCKIIKENQPLEILKAEELIEKQGNIPIFTAYYMQLSHIDYAMGNLIVPINEALKIALEEVLRYHFYRPITHQSGVVA